MKTAEGKRLSHRDLLGFDDRLYIAIAIPVLSTIIPFLLFRDAAYQSVPVFSTCWLMSLMYCASYWGAVRTIIARKRYRYPHPNQIWKRIGFSVLWVVVAYLIIDFLLDHFHHYVLQHSVLHKPSDIDTNIVSLTLIALCWSIYEVIYMYHGWKNSLNETERLKREFVQAQLDGLKSQVNPHFLFNSLNTLVYIIPEDADKAVEFVQRLAKVYRYILEIQERRLIPLWEEMEFLDSFMFLHKERFGDNLRVSIDVPKEDRGHLIVPLSLQLLFENAIKHNIISREKPLTIAMSVADGKKLIIRNSLQLRSNPEPGTQTGLANIQSRYRYFTDQPVVVEQNGRDFVVSLPLIQEAMVAVA